MQTTKHKIRNQVFRDLPEISDLSYQTNRALSVDNLKDRLKQKNCWCRVLENEDVIFGAVIYEVYPSIHKVTWIGVRDDSRRVGIGKQLLQDLKAKLSPDVRLIVEVPETDMEMLQFLKSQYFLAVELIKEDDEDIIVMEYLYDERDAPQERPIYG